MDRVGYATPGGSSYGDGIGCFRPVSGISTGTTISRYQLDHTVRVGRPHFYPESIIQIQHYLTRLSYQDGPGNPGDFIHILGAAPRRDNRREARLLQEINAT